MFVKVSHAQNSTDLLISKQKNEEIKKNLNDYRKLIKDYEALQKSYKNLKQQYDSCVAANLELTVKYNKLVKDYETKTKKHGFLYNLFHVSDSVITLSDLTFEQAKVKIEPSSLKSLTDLVEMLKNNPKLVIRLEGHTDFRGDRVKNMELSMLRVDAVKKYLLDATHIDERRIKTKAFGGSSPISLEDTEDGRRKNRRVEVRILKW